MCTTSIFRSKHHARKWRLVNSDPLSERIACGTPRSAMIPSNTRVMRRDTLHGSASWIGKTETLGNGIKGSEWK
jgi:hypothetical protein